jgi:hypothetical protein
MSNIVNGQLATAQDLASQFATFATPIASDAATLAPHLIDADLADHQTTTDQQQIQAIDQDVIALQALAGQFQQLEKFNGAAQLALATVTQMWAGLQADLQATIDELTTTESDVTAAQYQQANDDLGQAANAWDAVVTYATALANVAYNWQDSSGTWHTYGDGSQIQLDGATVVPIPQQNAA